MVKEMLRDFEILHKGTSILLGIALEKAVLDILTDVHLLQDCLKLLREPHLGLVSAPMGTFGVYSVTLSLGHDDTTAILIDGPDFDLCRTQCAGIWPYKEDLQRVLLKTIESASTGEIKREGEAKGA